MTETYRIRSPETWAQARDDYLFGHSAEQVCRRYDLSLRTFRRRARQEGWRRIDHADPDPLVEGEEHLHLFEDYDARELARIAHLRMAAAIVRGDALEATGWRRIHTTLKAEIEAEPEEATEPADAPPALDIETDPPERSSHVEAAVAFLRETHPEWRHWHGESGAPIEAASRALNPLAPANAGAQMENGMSGADGVAASPIPS